MLFFLSCYNDNVGLNNRPILKREKGLERERMQKQVLQKDGINGGDEREGAKMGQIVINAGFLS